MRQASTSVTETLSGRRLGYLDSDELQLLSYVLERQTGAGASYWIDAAIVETLADLGAPETLLDVMRMAAHNRDGVEVSFSNPLPELDPRFRPGLPFSAQFLSQRAKDEDEYESDDPAAEDEDEDGAAATEAAAAEASEYFFNGEELRCGMCDGALFRHRRVAIRTMSPGTGSDNIREEFADCRVCIYCGHVHWFLGRDAGAEGGC